MPSVTFPKTLRTFAVGNEANGTGKFAGVIPAVRSICPAGQDAASIGAKPTL